MNRLMHIAIHNDTSFLSRHEKIDYSFLVWIDHETKLIRVGIIDYIQYYGVMKFMENNIKRIAIGKDPTILNPISYKQRFQKAMNNYFMGVFTDLPSESFEELVNKQLEFKKQLAQNAPPLKVMEFEEESKIPIVKKSKVTFKNEGEESEEESTYLKVDDVEDTNS